MNLQITLWSFPHSTRKSTSTEGNAAFGAPKQKETSKLGAQHHIDPVTANLQALKSSKSQAELVPNWATLGGHWVERRLETLRTLNFDPSYSMGNMGILLALEACCKSQP